MVAELITGVGLFNSLLNIVKGLKDMNDAAIRNAAVIELQEGILAAQEAQATLVEQIRQLEEKVRSFETWETDKQRYELKEIGRGGRAYVLKEGMQPPELPHEVCANCYQDRRLSILQRETRNPGRAQILTCHRCGSDIYISGMWDPAHRVTNRGRR